MLKNYSKIEVDELGDKFYRNSKEELHRLDGPAVEYSNGSKFWYINENSHRNIDPSVEWSNEEKYWWFKGERHRIGGSCYSCGKWWFIDGKKYSKQEYFDIVWDI